MKVFIMAILGLIISAVTTFAADCTQKFSWLPNAETDIAGYKIHYGLTNGGPYPSIVNIAAPTPVDGRILGEVPGLICGNTYYFVCSAYNSTGLESDFSTQVGKLVTAPVVPGTVVTKTFGSATGADYIGAIQDTSINLDTVNNAASQQLNTYTWPVNKVANAIIMKIDFSQLPQDAQMQSASLQLYANGAGGDGVYDISVHKIINKNPILNASTGFTYNGTNGWTANTSCYNNIPMAQADIGAAAAVNSVGLTVGYKNWDVTNMVREWLANPSTNYGLLLNSDAIASADSYRNFASSEAADANQRPKLVLTYTVGVPRPSIFRISIK